MAIKVIKHGQKPKFTKVCPQCGCEFEYELDDLCSDTYYSYSVSLSSYSYPPRKKRYVICPDCGEKIYHDSIIDPDWTMPNVIYTNSEPAKDYWSKYDCSKCPSKPDLSKPIVGDSPCTWCPKMQPYCVNTNTTADFKFSDIKNYTTTVNGDYKSPDYSNVGNSNDIPEYSTNYTINQK